MSEPTNVDLEERLSGLERDLGPILRGVYRGNAMPPGFAARARARVFNAGSTTSAVRPALRINHPRAWATLAATLVGVLVLGGAVFAYRPQPVSAADVLDQLQAEAIGAMAETGGPCPGPGAPHEAATLVIQAGAPDAGLVGITSSSGNANDLSERLARALGVSGDRVRQAMIASLKTDLAAMPPEPMTAIAQRLGKTPAEVCAAFIDGQSPIGGLVVNGSSTSRTSAGVPEPHTQAVFSLGSRTIDSNSASADELREQPSAWGSAPSNSSPRCAPPCHRRRPHSPQTQTRSSGAWPAISA
jgi:hypothetical protein